MSKFANNCISFPYREPSGIINAYGIRARLILRENFTHAGNSESNEAYLKKSNSASKLSIIRLKKEQYQMKIEKSFNEIIAEQRERMTKTNNSLERIEQVFYTKHPKNVTIKQNNIFPLLKEHQKTPDPEQELEKGNPTIFAFVSAKPIQSEFIPRNVTCFKDMILNSRLETNHIVARKKNKRYKILPNKQNAINAKIDQDSSLYDNLFQTNTKLIRYGMVNLNTLRHVPGLHKRSMSRTVNNSSESTMIDQSLNSQIRALREFSLKKRPLGASN